MAKRKSKGNVLTALRKRFKTRGLFTSLAIISIIGFLGNTLSYFFGADPFSWFNYAAILLGVGLVFESHIKQALSSKRTQSYVITKVITFIVGLFVFIGGVLSIPAFNLTLHPVLQGAIVFANVIAIFVIFIEAFLVD